MINHPLFQFHYLYALAVISFIVVYRLSSKAGLDNRKMTVGLSQLDILMAGMYLIITFGIIRVERNLNFIDLYPLFIYPILYLLVRMIRSAEGFTKVFFLFLTLICGLEIFMGFQQAFNNNLSIEFKVTGSFGSPAVYTNYLVCILPLTFSLFLIEERWRATKVLYLILVASTLIILFAFCTSRLAWIAVLIQLGVFWHLQRNKSRESFRNNLIAIVIVGIVVTGLLLYKKDSTSGRWFVITNTLSLLKEHSIAGIGIGSFDKAYNDYQESYFKTHQDAFHSNLASYVSFAYTEYVQFVLEVGIVGLVGIVGATFKFYGLYRDVSGKEREQTYLDYGAFVSCITVLLLALVSFPFRVDCTWTTFICVLGLIFDQRIVRKFKIPFAVSFYALIILVIISLVPLLAFYSIQIRWVELSNLTKSKTISWSVSKKIYQELYPGLKQSPEFLEDYALRSYYNKSYSQSIDLLKQVNTFRSKYDNYLLLGMSYEQMHKPELAEKAYMKCNYMVPSLYASRFRLMMLYHKANNVDAARHWAKVIDRMPVKIPSHTVNSIKHNARNILEPDNMREFKSQN